MPGSTPTYSWPYQIPTDPPDGAGLGQALAIAIENTVAALASSLNGLTGQINGIPIFPGAGYLPDGVNYAIGAATNYATCPVGGGETPVPSASWTAEPTYNFNAGRIFRVHILCTQTNSTGTPPATVVVRLREGAQTISGTSLLANNTQNPGPYRYIDQMGYIKNATPNLITSKLSLTVQHFTVGATAAIGSDTNNQPLMIAVEDIGSIAAFPTLAAMAVALT